MSVAIDKYKERCVFVSVCVRVCVCKEDGIREMKRKALPECRRWKHQPRGVF